jgi:Fe-S-cluster-containing dehydrogenase component
MHPFDMTITDHTTGKKTKETRRKAAVCDLCTDQCLEEDEEPSCVYACPHDAAHRVDGQRFFELQLLGGRGDDTTEAQQATTPAAPGPVKNR